MGRLLGVLAMAILISGVVRADGLPPKGQKRVTVDHKITTEKEYPDFDFYTSVGGGRTVTAVKLDPKTPIEIKGAGRSAGIGRQGSLYAVPKDAAKKYDSEKAFLADLTKGKVEGQIRAKFNFDSTTSVKDTDPRTTVLLEWKLENLTAKDGFVMKYPKADDAPPPKKDGNEEGDFEDEPDAVAAYAPRSGVWVAGVAAALGVMLAGLWVARRSR